MIEFSNPDGSSKVIASYTLEQTAEFFGGGELGQPEIHDPELKAKWERQRGLLRHALRANVDILATAMRDDGQNTAARLRELYAAAEAGDPKAMRLLIAMLGELIVFALQ